MTDASEYLRRLSHGILGEALKQVTVRAALLAGSAGRGDADLYSDIDLLLYVEEVPAWEEIDRFASAVGGVELKHKPGSTDEFRSAEFLFRGVQTELVFVSLAYMDRRLDEVLTRIEHFDSPSQKILTGVLEGLVLHGRELVERWRIRVRDYPEPMRREVIRRHWKFFPIWYYREALAKRDAELWRLDLLLDAAFDVMAILAALNWLYFTRFQLKRTRDLVARMSMAPPDIAGRLERLAQLEPDAAADEVAKIVTETLALVRSELQDLELALPFDSAARLQGWSADSPD